MKLRSMISAALASVLAVACASTTPSVELINARTAYVHAEQSNAPVYAPNALRSARIALDRAEVEASDGYSYDERNLANIAMLAAQRAEALGNAAAATAANNALRAERARRQAEVIAAQQQRLRANENALARQNAELANQQANLANKQADLAAQQAETQAERQARMNAEARAANAEMKANDAMAALSRELAVKEDNRGIVITLSGGVLFETGKATLLPGAAGRLDKVADALRTQAERHFTIEGHTDSQGTYAINAELSARRANVVRDYLISRGVAADAVSAQGYGAERPLSDNRTAEGRAMNRRVEIIVDRPTSPNASATR